MTGNLIIISSPSGGGKGTLIKEILRKVPGIGYSVSYTTRKIREGEVNGKDYIFVSEEKFRELIDKGEFLEYANVHGNFYGTSVSQVQRQIAEEHDVILEIDVQGAGTVMKGLPDAVSIFILPPSYERLRERLINRATEDNDDLALRLKNSSIEVKRFHEFKYAVINDDLETAANQLATIILAERLNHTRQMTAIQCILDSFDN